MHDLEPITALWGTAPAVEKFAGLTISECPDWALASLAARHGQEEACAAGAAGYLGFALPDVGHSAHQDGLTAFWAGPQQWMVEAPHASHEDLAAQILRAVGDSASVTEQNDAWVRFDLEGPRAPDVLERLCNVDIFRMEQDHATRTQIETMGSFLVCRSKGTHFSVIAPRSSAESMHDALLTAARSVI